MQALERLEQGTCLSMIHLRRLDVPLAQLSCGVECTLDYVISCIAELVVREQRVRDAVHVEHDQRFDCATGVYRFELIASAHLTIEASTAEKKALDTIPLVVKAI